MNIHGTDKQPISVAQVSTIDFFSLRSAELRRDLKQKIPELLQLERLIRQYPQYLNVRNELALQFQHQEFPLYSVSLGNNDTNSPTLLLTGGMQG